METRSDLTLSSLRIDPSSDNASVAALDVEGPVTMTKTLSVTGASTLTGDVTFVGQTLGSKSKFTTKAFSSNRISISKDESGSVVGIPTTGAASTIGLPKISGNNLEGWNVRLVCLADNGAHTITIKQGAEVDGSGTVVNTPVFGNSIGVGDFDSINSTAGIQVAASKFKKGDYIDLFCDGTNYIVHGVLVTAAAVTGL